MTGSAWEEREKCGGALARLTLTSSHLRVFLSTIYSKATTLARSYEFIELVLVPLSEVRVFGLLGFCLEN